MKDIKHTLLTDAPTPIEEEFEDAFCEVLVTYKGDFIGNGYTKEQFAEWCCELVHKYI